MKSNILKKIIKMSFFIAGIAYCSQGLFAQPAYNVANSYGGSGLDLGKSVVTDLAGNIYVAGTFTGVIDFDPGTGVTNIHTGTMPAASYVCKYDAAGSLVWAKAIGVGNPSGGQGLCRDLCLDASGNILVCGWFYGTCDFDPGPTVQNMTAGGTLFNNFVVKLDPSGNFIWSNYAVGNSFTDAAAIATDAMGDVYITGYHDGKDFFGVSIILEATGGVNNNAYVAKLNGISGAWIWAKQFDAVVPNEESRGLGIATDATNNVYTTGYTFATTDFDPSGATYNLPRGSYISKLDASGNFIFAKTLAASGMSVGIGYGITLDNHGNIYTSGQFSGTLNFDPNGGTQNIVALGGYSIYVSKLDAAGNFIFAKQMGGSAGAMYDQAAYRIKLDDNNNIFLAGTFSGTNDFDPDGGIYNLTTAGGLDGFTCELDSNGVFICAGNYGGTGNDRLNGLALTATQMIITGGYNNTADFDPGAMAQNLVSAGDIDIFIAKYNEGSCSIITGNNELTDNKNSLFSIYPNPTMDMIYIDNVSEADISIINIMGIIVASKQNVSGSVSFDLSNIAKGTYFVRVFTDNKVSVKKVLLF
ncbi:MAG: T9SS type A sorting domain-containing protein [Bacteroidetes bacterium]|nr:T9SS type A sorting domain-containing protein [Bacteroidota bacterium]